MKDRATLGCIDGIAAKHAIPKICDGCLINETQQGITCRLIDSLAREVGRNPSRGQA
jgi:hypothetical protein